jgi:hypothetical protein
MGDRAQLCTVGTYPTPTGTERLAVWGFTHWEGEALPERVRRAILRARPRYADYAYMNRILWDAVCVGDWGSLDGYALGPRATDTEHDRPVLVVDLDARTVGVARLDRRNPLPEVARSISWADYCARSPRAWGRDLLATPKP